MTVADIVSSGSVPVKMLYLQKVPNTNGYNGYLKKYPD